MIRILALALSLAAPASAAEFTADAITVIDPVIAAKPAVTANAAGYMTIRNDGAGAETLIGADSALPRTMIHESVQADGVTRMQHRMAVEVPAGAAVRFAPGGLHVMFMGLEGRALQPGEEIPATLDFAGRAPLEVVFTVVAPGDVPRAGAAD